jgi:16S rRNA (uracil1498-N3)-methyltransferase
LIIYLSLKNPRFELLKLTELGVQIQPIITERVISKVKEKTSRWQSIVLSAMKQSQRCWLPKLNKPIEFTEAVSSCKSGTRLIAHEKALTPLTPLLKERGSVALFLGPEGGFTDEEVNFAYENGFKVFSLGARKYRSETAAVAAAVFILS